MVRMLCATSDVCSLFVYSGDPVRINIEIDDGLIDGAMRVSGLATKRETLQAGLRLLVPQSS
jgi:Arc/MetJ family transcription regulator